MIVYRYRQSPLIDDLLVYRHEVNAVLKKIREAETDETSPYQCCIIREHNTKSSWRTLADTIHKSVKEIFFIGVGGSSLGVRAVYEALASFDLQRPTIHFLETIDEQAVRPLYERFKKLLMDGLPVCLIVASKSGTTFEINLLANLFVAAFKASKEAPNRYLVILSDPESPLSKKADELGAYAIPTIKSVGGRFSVFTVAGLFPLACAGVDISQLCTGAAAMVEAALRTPLQSSAAGRVAVTLFWMYQRGITIHETFLFAPAYESVGKWYRQLVAETLGKAQDVSGKLIETGMFPAVSVGTTDLHSMGQLLFAGPRDKMVSFTLPVLPRETKQHQLQIAAGPFDDQFKTLMGQPISAAMKIVFDAVVDSYASTGRFCMAVEFISDPYGLGEYIMSKLLEVLYAAALYKIDPFSQPAVELYKKGIRDRVCW